MSSDFLDNLLNIFLKTQSVSVNGVRLQDWRVSLFQAEMITLGIKNNVGGSVYTPPAYKNTENAEIFLVWEDGKCTRASVQNADRGEEDWSSDLNYWRQAAYEDEYGREIPRPAGLPDVKIADEEIGSIIKDNHRYVFDQQDRILSDCPQQAVTDGKIMAMEGKTFLHTSTGIRADYRESRYAVSWSFDSIVSEGFAQRRLITAEEWAGLWRESVFKYHYLKIQGDPVKKDTKVILAPSVVAQMIEQYILPNFRGENVLNGQSRFTVQDFSQKTGFFNQNLLLEIDPLQPSKWASYRLTNEGITARKTVIVNRGRLEIPYLNVKNAKRWGAEPTAIPAGSEGITLKHINEVEWSSIFKGIQNGILILSVLGLHTQNPVSGSFSLAAPTAIRIRNGRCIGRTDVRINGNFWDILKDKETIYARDPFYSQPYLLTSALPENLS